MRTQLSAILDAVAELVAGGHLHRRAHVARRGRGRAAGGPTRCARRFPPEKALANAPAKVGTSFAVPRIIE